MRWYGVVVVLGGSLFVPACTARVQPDEPRTTQTPTSPSQTAQPELSLDTGNGQGPPVTLGATCNAEEDRAHCGTRGRVSVVATMNNGMPARRSDIPCQLVELDPEHFEMTSGRGCVEGDRVYLLASCMMCRIIAEWSMVGIVAEMTDAQLEAAQKRVGIAPEPLLHSSDGWRRAIASTAASSKRRKR
ncbi:MAG TPA: hypothetical protein VLT33_12140 [Labilithrix sp.]|nr:hypothetical protein [Labilithrix sp.]